MKAKDWRIEKKYCDRKNSPDAMEAFNQMVQDGVNREFDGIVFDTIFHFGRSFGFFKEVIRQTLYPANIHFTIVEDDFCSLDAEISGLRQITEQAESIQISSRLTTEMVQAFVEAVYLYEDNRMEVVFKC